MCKIGVERFHWATRTAQSRHPPICLNAAVALHKADIEQAYQRTYDGKALRTLNILDEHCRECLAIRVKRRLNSTEVIGALTDLFILRGV